MATKKVHNTNTTSEGKSEGSLSGKATFSIPIPTSSTKAATSRATGGGSNEASRTSSGNQRPRNSPGTFRFRPKGVQVSTPLRSDAKSVFRVAQQPSGSACNEPGLAHKRKKLLKKKRRAFHAQIA